VLLYVGDGEAALGRAHDLGLSPVSSLVRRSTLEDVFLRLTGKDPGRGEDPDVPG
jgi:lipooligosaccharide transport system ATP-binding protein